MGKAEEIEEAKTENVDHLVCKCKDCTHWIIGRDFIRCKTCGVKVKATIVVDDHDLLHWQKHQISN